VILAALVAPCALLGAGEEEAGPVGFGSERWVVRNGGVVEHLGRESFQGFASLEGVAFSDGVIEVDLAVDGRRSYPGIVFRMQSDSEYERIYLRPHRAGLYPDAAQYVPVFNGIAGWQLYNGAGYTGPVEIPAGEWVHLRLEVKGAQARLWVGDGEQPTLVIDDLKHGLSAGTIGVMGPSDGTAYFAGFSFRPDDSLELDPPPLTHPLPGAIARWELSRVFKLKQVDDEQTPEAQGLEDLGWEVVESEASGLVDVARFRARSGAEPDCVWARTVLKAEEARVMKLSFGYSDAVAVFLNGRALFTGASSYRQRDPSFLGIVGLFDTLYLPLDTGDNELLLLVAESFGGWGFMCQDAEAVFRAEGVVEVWRAEGGFLVPESVVVDETRGAIYVSNYDGYRRSGAEGLQSVSRLALDGTVKEIDWVQGFRNPTGMAVHGGSLFIVERTSVVEVDLDTGDVARRIPFPQVRFANDVAVDSSGVLYVSDSGANAILRSKDDAFEPWIVGGEIERANGLMVESGRLIVGNNGDGRLKAVDLSTGEVSTLAVLGEGIIDGVSADGHGNILVSHWEGRLFRVAPSGEVTLLLDTTAIGQNMADFGYRVGESLVVIPTFGGNEVVAYELPSNPKP